MKIICVGFPKTGTKSMAAALRQLGYSVNDFPEHLQGGSFYLKLYFLLVLHLQGGFIFLDFKSYFHWLTCYTSARRFDSDSLSPIKPNCILSNLDPFLAF